MKKTKEERLFSFLEKTLNTINREESGEAVHITEVITAKEVEKLIKDFGFSVKPNFDEEKIKKEAIRFIDALKFDTLDDFIGFEDEAEEWADDVKFNKLATKIFLKEIKNILKNK